MSGRTSILGSVEARLDLGKNFELTSFYDIGSIRNAPQGRGDDDFRSSAGLGLRYITPLGPAGLLYGWKLDRKKREGAGRPHFTIGYTF